MLCVVSVTITSMLAWRLVKIHVIESDKYQTAAAKSYIERAPLKSKRGFIMDARDNLLTNNIVNVSLIADRYRLDDVRMAALGLAYSTLMYSPEWKEKQASPEYNALSEEGKAKALNKAVERVRRHIINDLIIKTDAVEGDIFSSLEDFFEEGKKDQLVDDSQQEDKNKGVDKKKMADLIAKHEEYAVAIICDRLQINKEECLKKLRESKNKRIVLVQNLTDDQQEQLELDFRENKVQGFSFDRSERRWYTMPTMLSHVVGYTNFENKGQVGIERYLNKYLSGQDGFRQSSRDSRGLPLSSSLDKLKPAIHGLNLQLSVDMSLQAIAEEELDAGLAEMKAEKGTVILVEPKTGNILALACRPTYDLNLRNTKKEGDVNKEINPEVNFAVQGMYEPGSTFKVVTVSGALDAKKVTLSTMIDCGSKILVEGPVTLTDTSSYGMRTVEQVVQKSSNNGTYRIGKRLGYKAFLDYYTKFGFGQLTGVPLASEIKGNKQDASNIVNFSRMAIGYAVGVTPLQVAMAYAAIANNGVRMKPRLVTRIFDNDNKEYFADETKPQEVCRVISERAATDMRKALLTVMEPGGTGQRCRVPGFKVGGKTGTARRFSENRGGYADGQYVCSFAGIVPIENPAFVCLVVVDNPRTQQFTHYGGTIAGPIFQRVATRAAAQMNLTPSELIAPAKESQ